MMTYIEFFDKTHTENICACLSRAPERVVMIGKDRKQVEKAIERYSRVLKVRGQKTEFSAVSSNPNRLGNLVDFFEDTVNKYGHCVFDLTGGDDLYLVAAGIVFAKHTKGRIDLVRFNVNTGEFYDCDGNGQPLFNRLPSITIDENITIYGGRVIYDDNATRKWENTDGLYDDVDRMWEISKKDPRKWNSLTGMFDAADSVSHSSGLDVGANLSLLTTYTEKLITKRNFDFDTVNALLEKGLIKSWEFKGTKFELSYKNNNIKRCLTKAGQVLEMKVYLTALRAKERDGSPVYNDVMTGVCIDWDGRSTGFDTENEIDVMMMNGLIPVFVSCKNGAVEIDELYKLNTVAERFGGRYAKKALVASALDLDSGFGKTLVSRARDMGIKVLGSEIVSMSDEELERKIKSFCK